MRIQNGRATVTVRPDGRRRPSNWDAKSRKGNRHDVSRGSQERCARTGHLGRQGGGVAVATAFLALLVLYFVGMDQGATSVFGSNTYVHEFVHDARHLLGFPCH